MRGDQAQITGQRHEQAARVIGVPARPVRKMSPAEIEDIRGNARDYLALWHRDYRGR
jgi:carbonic anhydrase/acetyltransferase-like protein (isoleucine patch superfamily)